MRAKVIATGEVVNVHLIYTCANLKVYAEIEACRTWREDEIIIMSEEQQKQIDWEQRRFELVKAALPAAMNIRWHEQYIKVDNIVNTAIAYADAVIAKLKEEQS